MAQQSKKRIERYFVEEAAKFLDKKWSLGPDRERPDFIVTEGKQQFGLEVCEIFTGPQDKTGSYIKKKESNTQTAVNRLRKNYERIEDVPLIVKFNGDMCDENMTAVLPALEALKLSTKPLQYHKRFVVDKGRAMLDVYITRSLIADWYCLNDRIGWVNCNPIDRITEAIKEKSEKLPDYKTNTGLKNIRLLIVADRTKNSGKLVLQECPALDVGGFHRVYFFSYPENVQIFENHR